MAARIVIDARMLDWTGIGRYTGHLLQELATIDPDTRFVVLVAPSAAPGWHPPGENFEPCVAPQRPYSLAEQCRLPGLLRSLRADLVHFTHSNVPLPYRGPYVVTVHDLTMLRFVNGEHGGVARRLRYQLKRRGLQRTLASQARRARLVVTPSQATAADLAGTFGRDRRTMEVVHLAPETLGGAPEPVAGLAPDEPFLLHVGNFYPHKNLGALLAAFELLVADHPALRLVLAGAPNRFSDELAHQARAGAGAGRVLFPGRISDGQLAWLYARGALFVLPSRAEGFGLGGLEAMAAGLPVAAADTSCLPEIYGPGACYFDPEDPRDLARVAREVLESPARRAALVQAGTVRAAGFSWRRMAEETLACYRRALAMG